MSKKRMNEKQKLIAYVLSTDEDLNSSKNITQKEIADILGFSQPTIAQNIKETKYKIRINQLESKLSEIKREILQMEDMKVLELPSDINLEYKHKPWNKGSLWKIQK